MIDWLNANQSAVIALSTTVYTILTAVLAVGAFRAVSEQRKLRLAQFRPIMVADLEVDAERKLTFFSIANAGTATARNVRVAVDPPLTNPTNPDLDLGDLPLMRRGVDVLVPGKKLRHLIGVYGDWGPHLSRHQVDVTYEDDRGATFSEQFEVDLQVLSGLRQSAPEGLHTLNRHLKDLAEQMQELRRELRQYLSPRTDADDI